MRNQSSKRHKLVVLLGPTASGKTDWGLRLAKKFNGEIISADSRQIYTKMSIGTAKPDGEWKREGAHKVFYTDGIPHHLVDFVDPGKQFTLADFRDLAVKYIKRAIRRKHVPILLGGTGLYIQAVTDNLDIPRVPPNKKLRLGLEEKNLHSLVSLLKKLDPKALSLVDLRNKRRIIRALEVTIMSGEHFSSQRQKGESLFDTLKIGIKMPREELYRRIDMRTDEMIEKGLVSEVQALSRQKYGWQLPSMSGIGYRQFKPYIEGKTALAEAIAALKRDTRRYAKKQMTWFRRDAKIRWCTEYEEAERLVDEFLNFRF